MKQIIIGIVLAVYLVGCEEKPKFSISKNDQGSKYFNDKNFRQVYNTEYKYYFKGSPTTYYGLDMSGNDIFSGYVVILGYDSLCFSSLNFRGRKTFNSLVKQLKENKFIPKDLKPHEDLGEIEYIHTRSASEPISENNRYSMVSITYYTDFGFGYLRIQNSGAACIKAMF